MTDEKTSPLGALRRLFSDRRKHPRRRPLDGAAPLVGLRALGAGESELLFARLRDIGEGGLSASVEGGAQHLLAALGGDRDLSLIVELPAGTIAARGRLVYARPPDAGGAGGGYLLGAGFTDISSVDLERLRAYLAALA